ncbi:CDC24 calponin-domain-containing protein [Sporodiniella umbellata]|nr:CDC24 calponin-domain-containing protein [Sporodiniella umbellata]
MIDSPIATDSITNKQATQEASIYHTCRSVLNELSYIEGFDVYLKEEDLSDPLKRLWNICQPGISLCFLFNALNTDTPIALNHHQSKKYIYHFIVACKAQLHIPEDSLFTITELYEYDTNGFIKVTLL